jgi:hypothetical protein
MSNRFGYIKDKSVIVVVWIFCGMHRYFNRGHFCARSLLVSSLGLDAMIIMEYILNQERNDGTLH